ncbi:MAG: ABC transporter permease subunit [Actinomycetota bacterium]|nr:ABC transporter permease subunit [Actinomycetota bacterium]
MSAFSDAFTFVADNGHLLLTKTETHLVISGEAVLISVLVGVPLGVVLGHIHKGSFLAINASNLGRALPSLAVLSILLPVVGITRANVIITLVILGFPPILTNTYVAIEQVDADAVEAAKGMGMRPHQVILGVEMKLALPLIFAGVRTAAVFVVATATLAGVFGGGGLGDILFNRPEYKLSGLIGASYILVVLALAAQVLFKALELIVTPTGLRKRPRADTAQTIDPRVLQPA